MERRAEGRGRRAWGKGHGAKGRGRRAWSKGNGAEGKEPRAWSIGQRAYQQANVEGMYSIFL